jgi:hypothetical protein
MSRTLVVGGGIAILAMSIVAWRLREASRDTPILFEPSTRLIEPAPVCPWREPDADAQFFFPGANRHFIEKRILSGVRVELAKRLNRQPDSEENTLNLHRVYQDSRALGIVLARRVKGDHGAIEIVLATTIQGEVHGVRLQRLREPPAVADTLQDSAWLKRFQGRTSVRGWENDDVLDLQPAARDSAQAIREGIRSLLILLAVSEGPGVPSSGRPHH